MEYGCWRRCLIEAVSLLTLEIESINFERFPINQCFLNGIKAGRYAAATRGLSE
jgi:hypothetical protein